MFILKVCIQGRFFIFYIQKFVVIFHPNRISLIYNDFKEIDITLFNYLQC